MFSADLKDAWNKAMASLLGTILQQKVLEINAVTLTKISPNYHKLYIHRMSSSTAAGPVLKNKPPQKEKCITEQKSFTLLETT